MSNPPGAPYGDTPGRQATAAPPGSEDGIPIAGDSAEPLSVRRLLVALALVLVVALAAVVAVDYVRRREPVRDRETGPRGTELDSRWAEDAAEEASGVWLSTATVGRYGWPVILIFAVAVGPILFLTVLLRGLAIPSWLPGAQLGTLRTLHDVAPYLLAFSFGAMIGVAEVVNTFPAFTAEALGTRWATLLVLFNALGTSIVYAIVTAYSSAVDHPLLRVFGIAVGFAILIRTRFVLARDLHGDWGRGGGDGSGGGGGSGNGEGRGEGRGGDRGGDHGGGVSLDFGWLYGRFQQLCRQRIERDLLRSRRYATWRLLALYPDTESLRRLAAHVIRAQAPSAAEDLPARFAAICAEDLPDGIIRARIAHFIAETGGRRHTAFLIEHSTAPGASIAPEVSPAEP